MISDLTTIRDEVQAALNDLVNSNFGQARKRLAELDDELQDTPLELVHFSPGGYRAMKGAIGNEIARRAEKIAKEQAQMEG